ncbi:uncharacterized protein [Diabrotica undecimpunctata]|uniref:uncharacterized protein isoform X2 n=1 Tax=Diabrotica undecimpunctata TaxID=50387 RepID=UPI003B6412CA
MLERTTRSYFEEVFTDDFKYLQSNISERRNTKGSVRLRQRSDDLLLDEHIMTRKTRTRRPRISALQSGYCAVCNVPYNNVEDHIQSKKHQKLIGEDANYIALNGSLNGFLQNNSIPFLNLNGIDAIGVHETSLDDFSPMHKKRNMRRTRAASVMFDRVNPSPLSPTGSDITGHHLRSRRNINYMTPPLDEDSLQEKPDLTLVEEPQELVESKEKEKETKGLRSTTRSLTKVVCPVAENNKEEEVWNSGRPKRACISKKRLSTDERLNSSCKTYYKVEVVTPKLRQNSATKSQESTKRQQSQSPKRDDEKEKGLIVKFKKLRNSELIQLNNEATNFLFPKKDDSSEEEDDEANTTASSADSCSNTEIEDCKTSTPNVKNEDETSMDSTGKKKRRRTHAEAFIMDNQKYYKFETPGSRLRYQGSYLPLVMKSPERPAKVEEDVKIEVPPEEKKVKHVQSSKIKLSKYKFAFEQVPIHMGWYQAFQRLDNTEQTYPCFSNYLWEEIALPYQMRSIQPLDRKSCISHYQELLKGLMAVASVKSESTTRSPSPESMSSSSSLYDPDEDSKLSASTSSSICSADDRSAKVAKVGARKSSRVILPQPTSSSGKNSRKSPRQHASTLAILSDLIQQRKRRSKHRQPVEDVNQALTTIEEEQEILSAPVQEEVAPEPPPPPVRSPSPPPVQENECPPNPQNQTSPVKSRKMKPKIDYHSVVKQIDDELDTALDGDIDIEDYEIEMSDGNGVDFNNSRTTLDDIMGMYEENNSKETEKSCRRFFNGTPGRKPGYKKRKLNKTGWPSKTKKSSKKEPNKEKSEDENSSTVGSASVINSEAEDCDEGANVQETVEKQKPETMKRNSRRKEAPKNAKSRASDQSCDVTKSRVKVLSNKLVNSELPQPYVCVQKLDSKKLSKTVIVTPQRTTKKQRRMPGSPKSPRTLRKPRGRWYRER